MNYGKTIRVLLVEDDPADAGLIREYLFSSAATSFRFEQSDRLDTGLARLRQGDIDVVLLDLSLPESRGIETLRAVVAENPGIPIVVLTGLEDEELAVRMVQEGAQDYLPKGEINGRSLARAIRYAVERQALLAEVEAKNRELENFAHTVSHDLRNPLLTVEGFLRICEEELAAGNLEGARAQIAPAVNTVRDMDGMIRGVLQLARVGRVVGTWEELSLEELARRGVELVGERIAQRGVEVKISPDLPVVCGDRARLVQVFQNLVDNAVRYMADQPRPRIEIGATLSGDAVLCYVQDNGMGIAAKHHQQIFHPFRRLDVTTDGSGLGLSLVKRIVEVHGGRVWVESDGPGQGSTFCFFLPRTPSPDRLRGGEDALRDGVP